MDVAQWLRSLGLAQYEQAFRDNAVDADVLPRLTSDDLKELGVTAVGHRRKLLDAIAGLASRPIEETANLSGVRPRNDPGRRQVTVLFADLVGYTALAEALEAEDIHALLEQFFACVDGIVLDHGGTVDKHIGDCVMAVFGAPVAHGNDASRAVHAALAITRAMPGLSHRCGRKVDVHIGVASGHVIAGETGSSGHHSYTVTGASVNLASRLSDRAGPGEILSAEALARELADHVVFEPVGELSVKGFHQPVTAWRVLGPVHVHPEGRPLVGRIAESQQLRAALSRCREIGRGQTICIRGEAGIGKTRLVETFQTAAQEAGFRVHMGHVPDFGAEAGRDLIRTLVRSLLDLAPWSDAVAARYAAAGAVARGFMDSHDILFLNDLLDLPQPRELRGVYDAMDPATRDQGRCRSIRHLVEQASRTEPRVIIVEDLHWADDPTVRTVADLAAAAAACPLLLLVTSRIEDDATRQVWHTQCPDVPLATIDLGPLTDEEARLMARGYAARDDEQVERCLRRAMGHPLFIDQLLRHAGESTDADVPGSIRSLVQARLDRLDAHDRAALQAASVLGQRFGLDALRHLLSQAGYRPDSLIAHGFIQPHADVFLFAHALIRDAVYDSLLRSQGRVLHRRAAEWFAARDPVLRAEHLDRAEASEASQAYLEAAQSAAAALHHAHALSLAERGLTLAVSPSERQHLGLLRGELLRELGRTSEALGLFRQMLDEVPDGQGRCQVLIDIASCVRLLGGFQEGMEALNEAEPLAHGLGADRDLARIAYYRGCLLFAAGRIDPCLAAHEQAFACARRAGDVEWQAWALSGLGDAHYGKGRMGSAIASFMQCRSLCQRHGLGRIEVGSLHMIGLLRRYLLECREAVGDLRTAVEMAIQVGNLRTEMLARIILGELLVDAGDLPAACDTLSGALAIADRLGNRRYRGYALYELGRAVWGTADRRDEARQNLTEALALSRAADPSFIGPRVLAALAMTGAPSWVEHLDEGEAIIRSGCLAHNGLWFYRDAIEASLSAADWDRAERYAEALYLHTRSEPLPWADFFIARGRTLAALGRGERTSVVEGDLQSLHDEAVRVGLLTPLVALEAGLRSGGGSARTTLV